MTQHTQQHNDGWHAGAIWTYQDSRGVPQVGHLVRVDDFGGTDVPYTFRSCGTGEVSVVSGRRLMRAAPSYSHTCGIRDRLIAEWERS